MVRNKITRIRICLAVLLSLGVLFLWLLAYNNKYVKRFNGGGLFAKVVINLDNARVWIPKNGICEYGSLFATYNDECICYLITEEGRRYKTELNSNYSEYLTLCEQSEDGSYYSFSVRPQYFRCYARYSTRTYDSINAVTDQIWTSNAEYEIYLRPVFKERSIEHPASFFDYLDMLRRPGLAPSVFSQCYYSLFVRKQSFFGGMIRSYRICRFDKNDVLFVYRSNKYPELAFLFQDSGAEQAERTIQYPALYSTQTKVKEILIHQINGGSFYMIEEPGKVKGKCNLYAWDGENYLLWIGPETESVDGDRIKDAVSEVVEGVNTYYYQGNGCPK